MDAMASLSLAIKSLLGWAWDIFSINIPILNIPFWVIAMAAVAVDLAFYMPLLHSASAIARFFEDSCSSSPGPQLSSFC